jgi:hypothetical protein
MIDPMTGMAIISAGKGLWDLFGGKKNKSQQPPVYQAPTQQSYQETYQNSPMYQEILKAYQTGNQTGSYLPTGYRESVLGQARRDLGYQQDLDQNQAMESANKHNLLGSGSLGVRQGMIGDNYTRQFANVNDSLNQQDFAERSRLMGMLGQQEGNLMGIANQNAQLGYQSQLNQWNAGQARQQSGMDSLFSAAQMYNQPDYVKNLTQAFGGFQPQQQKASPFAGVFGAASAAQGARR